MNSNAVVVAAIIIRVVIGLSLGDVVIALAGLFFIVPGGIFILGALCLCWLGDRLISSKGGGTDFATTIEEYEEHMTEDDYRNDPDVRDNERIWTDFYGDKL